MATEANIVTHHVLSNLRCSLCSFHWSDTTHALLFCQILRGTWKDTGWWKIIKSLKGLSTKDLLTGLNPRYLLPNLTSFVRRLGEFGRIGVLQSTTPILVALLTRESTL